MTGTIKVALTALHRVNEYKQEDFLVHLPYRPSIHQLVDCKHLANLTVNKIRELHIDHTVMVDCKTGYRLEDTVIELGINALKENISVICEALNLRPASDLSASSSEIKRLQVISAEAPNWRD